jgi:EmrB/QacA subfamily drug resistance transporter
MQRAPRTIALIVASALFMQNMDSAVIAVALPAIAENFDADPLRMNLALTAYMLALAMCIPASGWAADRFGAKRVFLAAIGLFTLASLLCGASQSLAQLVAARMLQGGAGAMMVPVGRLLLLRATPKNELLNAMAWLTVPALMGPVLGPPLGGLIVTFTSWRWIFGLNLPVGMVGAALVWRFIPDEPPAGHAVLDVPGMVLTALSLAGFVAGIETVGRGIVPVWVTWALLGVGALAAGVYALHMRRVARPALELRLARIPTFGLSMAAGTLFRLGVGAMPFLIPMTLQLGLGLSAAAAGAITFVNGLGALLMKPAARPVLRRFGFRRVLGVNALVSSLGIAACAVFAPGTPLWVIYAVLLVGSFLRSLEFTAFNTLAYADIPARSMSQATSLYSTVQQLSLTLGVAIGAGALEFSVRVGGHTHPEPDDFALAFLVVAAASALAAPLCWFLAKDAGQEVSGHGG